MLVTEPAFTDDSRHAALARLRAEEFDVLILGGGINGAGIARDLCLRARIAGRPLRVALVEQRHFASGTSGKNSQLIHGGLRYLKYLEFHLVREALRERATLLEIAPHLVEPLPFLIPFDTQWARFYYGAGLVLYDLLAGKRNIGHRRSLSRDEMARLEPGFALDRLAAAAIYYDAAVHSARLVLENVFDAVRDGAVAANYVRAEKKVRRGDRFEVALRDMLTGESFPATARKLVDTTGPWQRESPLRLVRGSHIILPRLNASDHAIAHFGKDGRIIFIIPWGEKKNLSLVGTTDYDHESGPDEVRISADEIRYLLNAVELLYPNSRGQRLISAFSSLRPLVKEEKHSATQTSREHRIWNSGEGVLYVAGGKYTTYRLMSEEAADLVCRELAPPLAGACRTKEEPLGGNSWEWLKKTLESAPKLAREHGLKEAEVSILIRRYGRLISALLGGLEREPFPGLGTIESAVVRFAVEHEMARRLADVLFVSTYWGYEREWSAETLGPISRAMGELLGWSDEKRDEEVRLVLDLLAIPDY